MAGVNGFDAPVLLKPLAKELHHDNGATTVDYHLNNLLASTTDLTPQEIADASRTTAAAAASAAKAARAIAEEKSAAASKAFAAAKAALELVASFPKTNQAAVQDAYPARDNNLNKQPVAAADDDLFYSKDEQHLPSNLQLGDVSQGVMPNSSSPVVERQNNPEHAISKTVDFNGLGLELGTSNETPVGEGAKEGIPLNRKRGRPKSK